MKILFLYLISIFLLSISNNWLVFWMMLELNVIFLIMSFWKQTNKELFIKYFLIQAINSMMIIFSMIFNLYFILWCIILLKMGIPPFHLWFLDLLKFMSTSCVFLLLTLQKLPFFFLIFFFPLMSNLVIFLLINSLIITIISMIVMNFFSWFIVFSSMNHTYWLFLSQIMSKKLFSQYFLVYFFFLGAILIMMNKIDSFFLVPISQTLTITFLILSGVPPFIFFFFKWMILIFFTSFNYYIVLMILMILIYLFFAYFRVFFFNFSNKWINKMSYEKFIFFLIMPLILLFSNKQLLFSK